MIEGSTGKLDGDWSLFAVEAGHFMCPPRSKYVRADLCFLKLLFFYISFAHSTAWWSNEL